MSWLDLPQTNREELLDLHSGSLAEVRRSLHDIRRINTYLGGAKVVCDATFAMLQRHGLKRATVLDIGTGSADIPLRLQREAKNRDIELRVLALDVNARHLRVARDDLNTKNTPGIHLLQADAFRLPLRDHSVDVVVSSLFLHHFREAQIIALLQEFERVSSRGWIMNDLIRHNIPLWFFRLTRPIFARSYITRHDGEASLRRAYTRREMQRMVGTMPIKNVNVREHFPYRLSIVRDKN